MLALLVLLLVRLRLFTSRQHQTPRSAHGQQEGLTGVATKALGTTLPGNGRLGLRTICNAHSVHSAHTVPILQGEIGDFCYNWQYSCLYIPYYTPTMLDNLMPKHSSSYTSQTHQSDSVVTSRSSDHDSILANASIVLSSRAMSSEGSFSSRDCGLRIEGVLDLVVPEWTS